MIGSSPAATGPTPSNLTYTQPCSGIQRPAGRLWPWHSPLPLFLPPPAHRGSFLLIRNSSERRQRGIHPTRSQSKEWDARSPDVNDCIRRPDGWRWGAQQGGVLSAWRLSRRNKHAAASGLPSEALAWQRAGGILTQALLASNT